MRLEYDASFILQCQRCLEPMEERVSRRASFVIVGGDSIPAGIPEDHEPVELAGDRFQPAGFVEDELIMSLPLIPRHARLEQCGALVRGLGPPEDGSDRDSTATPLAKH